MKKLLAFSFLFLFASFSHAQNWQWAKSIGGVGADAGSALFDSSNNIYCSGFFESNLFLENDTLVATGFNDMFIVKYDNLANEIWSKKFGGNNPNSEIESGGIIAIDNANSVFYFSGSFYGSLTFGNLTINSIGGLDAFIAKFDLSGNCIWVKNAGSLLNDRPCASTIDSNGNLFWTVSLAMNGTLDSTNLSAGCFISKIDINGNVLFARNFVNGGYTSGVKLANGELIFAINTTRDTTLVDTMLFVTSSPIDIILTKVNLNGNVTSGIRFGGNLNQYSTSIELDKNNNIFLTGTFESNLQIGTTNLSCFSNKDLFIAKFDSIYNLVWINQSNTTGTYGAIANSIKLDLGGNLYASGSFHGNANFGSLFISSNTTQDFFIARLDSTGNFISINNFGIAMAGKISISSNGNPLVSGTFSNTINIGSTQLISQGGGDMFFAKLDSITGTSNSKVKSTNQLLIQSNPNSGRCFITIPESLQHEKNLTLSIYNNNGQLIQHFLLQLNQGQVKLNLEAEAKGLYNAVLSNGVKSYSGKIVFE